MQTLTRGGGARRRRGKPDAAHAVWPWTVARILNDELASRHVPGGRQSKQVQLRRMHSAWQRGCERPPCICRAHPFRKQYSGFAPQYDSRYSMYPRSVITAAPRTVPAAPRVP